MSDLGDTFKAWREEKQEKRAANVVNTIRLLEARGIEYQRLSEHHLRVGQYDLWPSTGTWISRVNKHSKGRGVLNLLCRLEKPTPPQSAT